MGTSSLRQRNSRIRRTASIFIATLLLSACLSPIGQTPSPTISQTTAVITAPSNSPSPTSFRASTPTLQPTATSTAKPSRTSTATPTQPAETQPPTLTPTISPTSGPIGLLQLKVYDLLMEYKTTRWQEDKPDEMGRKSLSHTIFPNCQIREFGPAHILGEFKYHLILGQHMFSIYEYTKEKEGQPVLIREYVIEKQTPASTQTPSPTPIAKPYFLVAAPASNPEPCIVSAHAVLTTLHEPPTP